MNNLIKQQWINALRSGEYKQCQNWLRNNYTFDSKPEFCPLGVLCDLHSKATETPWKRSSYLRSSTTLPKTVQQWAGLDSDNPILRGEVSVGTLSDTGETCEYIAEQIEKYL